MNWLLIFLAYWFCSYLMMLEWMKRNKKEVDRKLLISLFFASVFLIPMIFAALAHAIYIRLKRKS